MRLYLIRHAELTNNKLATSGGDWRTRSHDPSLTELGFKQAALLADHLAQAADHPAHLGGGYDFTHLYCSPMLRTLQTAQPVAKVLGMNPEVWVDIHEVGGIFLEKEAGVVEGFPGLTRTEITAQFEGYVLPDEITEDGWWNVEQGRETAAQFLSRALRVTLSLKERTHNEETIALIVHGAFIDAVLKAFLNQLPSHPEQLFYGHYNTGITRIDFNERNGRDHMSIHYMNRVDHIPTDMRSW